MSSGALIAVCFAGAAGCSSASLENPADAAMAIDGSMTDDAGVARFSPGVYFPSFGTPLSKAPYSAALLVADVDGVYISHLWSDIESTKGQRDFSRLNADLDAAIAAHKKISFSIRAGASTPGWVCAGNPLCVTLTTYPPVQRICKTITIPMPWDILFLSAWHDFLIALKTDLMANPGYYAAISHIKITGVNNFTDETSLPYEPLVDTVIGTCAVSGAVNRLQSVQYSTDKVKSAWVTIAGYYQTLFPDKMLDYQAISKGFLKISSTDDSNLTSTLIQTGAAMFPAGFIVQANGLSAASGTQPPAWAAIPGVVLGNQMLNYVYGDPLCQMGKNLAPNSDGGVVCDETVLRAAVDSGLSKGDRFLEIYATDIVHFGSTITYAHQKLLGL